MRDANIKNIEKVNIKIFCVKLKSSNVHDRLCIKPLVVTSVQRERTSNMSYHKDLDYRNNDRSTIFDAFLQEDAGKRRRKNDDKRTEETRSDEETAKNDNDETRGRRKREAQKRGRRARETGPR